MARQLTFDLPVRQALGREAFYVSPANEVAASTVAGWRGWPAGKLALTGPEGAGKSHLVQVWAGEADALVMAAGAAGRPPEGRNVALEDVDRIAGDAAAEEAVFHLHNAVLAHGGRLLVTGRLSPSAWGLRLPDLASRMAGTPMVRIEAPDDALLAAVLSKHFADRQIRPPAPLIPYLLRRMKRSFAEAARIVEALDTEALEHRQTLSRKLAGAILDKLEAGGS
jgi:chromosomal replication initiation ATPase DnaA